MRRRPPSGGSLALSLAAVVLSACPETPVEPDAGSADAAPDEAPPMPGTIRCRTTISRCCRSAAAG